MIVKHAPCRPTDRHNTNYPAPPPCPVLGPSGVVYAVEFSHRPGRDLINMAKLRTNVIPIVEVRLR